jgi:hypothetical protein
MRHIKGRGFKGEKPRCKVVKAVEDDTDRGRLAEEAWMSVRIASAKRGGGSGGSRGVRADVEFGTGTGSGGERGDGMVGMLSEDGLGSSGTGTRPGSGVGGPEGSTSDRVNLMDIGFLVS